MRGVEAKRCYTGTEGIDIHNVGTNQREVIEAFGAHVLSRAAASAELVNTTEGGDRQNGHSDTRWRAVGKRCYHPAMGVRKLSVALNEHVADAAAASAERLGLSLSAWLNRAAENALAIEDGLAAVAEWEAEHGALTAEELDAADAALDGSSELAR